MYNIFIYFAINGEYTKIIINLFHNTLSLCIHELCELSNPSHFT